MGTHLLDLFSNKAELRDAIGVEIWLVAEGNRLQRKDRFARLVHRFDCFLESRRGDNRAELTVWICHYLHAVRHSRSEDARNKRGRVCLRATNADRTRVAGTS